jgi:hypothetical protein
VLDSEAESTRIFRNVDNCFTVDMELLARTLEMFRNVRMKTSNLASTALFGRFLGVNFSRDVVVFITHLR